MQNNINTTHKESVIIEIPNTSSLKNNMPIPINSSAEIEILGMNGVIFFIKIRGDNDN